MRLAKDNLRYNPHMEKFCDASLANDDSHEPEPTGAASLPAEPPQRPVTAAEQSATETYKDKENFSDSAMQITAPRLTGEDAHKIVFSKKNKNEQILEAVILANGISDRELGIARNQITQERQLWWWPTRTIASYGTSAGLFVNLFTSSGAQHTVGAVCSVLWGGYGIWKLATRNFAPTENLVAPSPRSETVVTRVLELRERAQLLKAMVNQPS